MQEFSHQAGSLSPRSRVHHRLLESEQHGATGLKIRTSKKVEALFIALGSNWTSYTRAGCKMLHTFDLGGSQEDHLTKRKHYTSCAAPHRRLDAIIWTRFLQLGDTGTTVALAITETHWNPSWVNQTRALAHIQKKHRKTYVCPHVSRHII